MVELSEFQKLLIAKIAKKNGFDKYELITDTGTSKGDNFLGILTTVTIKNADKKLELILKAAHQNEGIRKATPLHAAYMREIYLYKNIFSEFKKFQEEYNVADPFRSYSKIYEALTDDENECLVMENLKTNGYQLWNKRNPMNSEHISAVLNEYAKFHSISVAMKHKNPELFEKLTKTISKSIFQNGNMEYKFFEKYVTATMDVAFKAVEGQTDLTELLKKIESKIPDLFFKEFADAEYKQVVIHGDCWCNNFMFKYEEENDKTKPSSLKIIDWQISHINSPGNDFCYFFLAHSPKEILNDYKKYLNLYYETFSRHLRSFDCDPDEIFPYSRNWPFGNWYCTVSNFIANATVAASVFTLTGISCDRYLAIVYPLQPRMSKTSSIFTITFIWTASMILAMPCLLYSRTVTHPAKDMPRTGCILVWPDEKLYGSEYDLWYQMIFLLITYIVPMILMSICYTIMGSVLWGSRSIGEKTQRQIDAIKSKRRVVKMFISVVMIFGVCWLPYHGYFIYVYFDTNILFHKYTQHVYLGFYWFAMSNAMVNPLIYYWMNARFRKYFKSAACFCRTRRKSTDSSPPFNGRHFHSLSKSGGNGTIRVRVTSPREPEFHNGNPLQEYSPVNRPNNADTESLTSRNWSRKKTKTTTEL